MGFDFVERGDVVKVYYVTGIILLLSKRGWHQMTDSGMDSLCVVRALEYFVKLFCILRGTIAKKLGSTCYRALYLTSEYTIRYFWIKCLIMSIFHRGREKFLISMLRECNCS